MNRCDECEMARATHGVNIVVDGNPCTERVCIDCLIMLCQTLGVDPRRPSHVQAIAPQVPVDLFPVSDEP